MFCRAEAFNQSLEKWDFSKVIDTSNMFDEANINMISRYGKDEEKSIDSEVLKTWIPYKTQKLKLMRLIKPKC